MQMLLAIAVAILVAAREVCVCYWAIAPLQPPIDGRAGC
jgi:hypothetical protein